MKTKTANFAFFLIILMLSVAWQIRPAYCSPEVLFLKSYDVQDLPTPSAPTVGVRRQMDWNTGGTQESYTFDATGETGYWYTQRYTGTLAAGTFTATLYYTATGSTLTIRPNAAGTYQQWSTFGDTVHWQLTSDQSDSTGVQVTGSTTLKETENLADTTQTGTINSVTAYMRAKATSDGADEYTNAFIAYRSNTGTNLLSSPKNRLWIGSWNSEVEMSTAGSPVRFVRTAVCPISTRPAEKIVVTLSDDGYLDAYVFDGISWTVTNNIGNVGTTARAYKCFDIAYEKTSGEALLVYAISSTNTAQDLAYKTWIFGTGWSSEYYIDDTGHTTDVQYRFVTLASNPTSGSNEITMVALDGTNSDGNGWVWNGSSWGSIYELDATVSIITEECIAVAYETTSGRAWTAVGSGTTASTFSMRSQTAGTWNATKESPNIGGVPNWCTLKGDPASNKMMLVSVDGSSDLNIIYYTGSGSWTVNAGTFAEDTAVDTNAARCADFAWEPSGSVGIIVWGTTSNALSARKFTAATPAWSALTPSGSVLGTHPWVQLRTNTRSISGDIKILGAMLNSNYDLGALKWDGTTLTLIGDATFTADTTVTTYECFEMEFELYPPREQAVILWRTYSTDYESSATTISRTAFTDYSEQRTNNPNSGSAWTWTEVNALQIGSRASTLGSTETIQVSEYWIVVTYSICDLTLEVARTSPDGQTVTVIGTSTTVNFATTETVTSKVIDITTTATPETFNDERLRLRITWSSGSITLYWDSSSTQAQLSTPSGSPPIPEFPSTEFQIAILVINLLVVTYLLRRAKKSTRK